MIAKGTNLNIPFARAVWIALAFVLGCGRSISTSIESQIDDAEYTYTYHWGAWDRVAFCKFEPDEGLCTRVVFDFHGLGGDTCQDTPVSKSWATAYAIRFPALSCSESKPPIETTEVARDVAGSYCASPFETGQVELLLQFNDGLTARLSKTEVQRGDCPPF